jgi:hypothetical protein
MDIAAFYWSVGQLICAIPETSADVTFWPGGRRELSTRLPTGATVAHAKAFIAQIREVSQYSILACIDGSTPPDAEVLAHDCVVEVFVGITVLLDMQKVVVWIVTAKGPVIVGDLLRQYARDYRMDLKLLSLTYWNPVEGIDPAAQLAALRYAATDRLCCAASN